MKSQKRYQEKEWLQKQFDELVHVRTIARTHGISEWTVNHWAKKLGVEKHPHRKMSRRKGNLNQEFFSQIDTEEKAYWLGFLMADGSVSRTAKGGAYNRCTILLKADEIDHLERFKKDISSNALITTKIVANKKRDFESSICNINVNSIKVVSDLMSHGIVPNKTGTEHIPDSVPNDLIRHFIRGFFDGDGSITKAKAFRIASASKKILAQINEFFNQELGFNFKIYTSDAYAKPFYAIDSRSHPKSKAALELIYQDATIFLGRKYQRYNELYCSPATNHS